MEWVASTLHTTSERGVSSITTADAHTSAASSRLNWRRRRFKWSRPFRRKTKSGFCACAFTFQTQSTFLWTISLRRHISKHSIFHSHSHKNLTVLSHKIRGLKNILAWITSSDDTKLSYRKSVIYRGADKSLARPTPWCILFDGKNISFDSSLVIYIKSTNILPIMIINRI